MTRPPSSDEPSREVWHHMQRPRWRRTSGLYVMSDGAHSQAAYTEPTASLQLGRPYIAEREPAKNLWRVDVPPGGAYYDHYITDLYTGDSGSDYSPDASPTSGSLVYIVPPNPPAGPSPGVSFSTLRNGVVTGSGQVGGGYLTSGIVALSTGTSPLWARLVRSVSAWAFAVMPLGTVIKRAQLIGYPQQVFGAAAPAPYAPGIPGQQVGWIKSNKPIENDGTVDIDTNTTTDWTLDGDDPDVLMTDLIDIDTIEAGMPADAVTNPFFSKVTRPDPVVWNFTAAGVVYLQEIFDGGDPFFRKVRLKMLLECDRTETAPDYIADSQVSFGMNWGYFSEDGLYAPLPIIRCYI